jgi:hypothetical protein
MDRETQAHQAGMRGEFFSPNTYAELMAYERGAGGSSGGLPLPVLAFLACAAACFWPLVGVLALLGAALAVWGVENAGADAGGMAQFASFFVGAGAGVYVGFKIERVLQRSFVYRLVRHVLRLILLGCLFIYWLLLANPGQLYLPDSLTFEWLHAQLSPGDYAAVAVGVILVHYLSRRFDTRIELALAARRLVGVASTAEANAEVKAVERELAVSHAERRAQLWARRRKSGLIFGVAAAIFLIVVGASTSNVIFGVMVFGLIGVLVSRWVIRAPKIPAQSPSDSHPPV